MAIALPVATDPLAVTHHRNISASRRVVVPTTNLTLDPTHNNAVIAIATDAIVMTLPQVATLDPGYSVIFVAHVAAGAILLTVTANGSDAIWGSIQCVTGTNTTTLFTSTGAAGNSIKLTKATQRVDDWVMIVSTGLTDWMIIGGQGTWTN